MPPSELTTSPARAHGGYSLVQTDTYVKNHSHALGTPESALPHMAVGQHLQVADARLWNRRIGAAGGTAS